MNKILTTFIIFVLLIATRSAAMADPGYYHHHHVYHHVLSVGGPLPVGGHWYHGWHNGRDAWWWVLNGTWILRPAPVVTYGYPGYYAPPYGYPAHAPGNIAYYCPRPHGYYPYVAQCARPWDTVVVP